MKKSLLLIVAVLFLAATACKQGNTETEYTGCGAVNTPDIEKYTLKAGSEIRSIFVNYGIQTENVTKVKASSLPPDSNIPERNKHYIDLNDKDVVCWLDENDKTIYFYADRVTTPDKSKKIILPQNCSNMFYNCEYLTQIDLSFFDTSRVTNMYEMFYNCSNLKSLDLSNFDTHNVTNMDRMFTHCDELETLTFSNSFDTSNVISMSNMFTYCGKLKSLDLSHFDTRNVLEMGFLFGECYSLESIILSELFDTSHITSMAWMFCNCCNLTNLDISHFNTSNVKNMYAMFGGCGKITSLDFSNADTSKVTDMACLFSGCSSLTTIYTSDSFVTTSLIESDGHGSHQMFGGCIVLSGGNGTTYDTNHTNKEYARIDAEGTPGYFTRKPTTP